MGKTITLKTEVGVEMPVNINELQRFASGKRNEPNSLWIVLRLVTCESSDDGWTLTPRGEDLLASAHLIPDDPAPEQPSAPPCETCNGTGERVLFVSTYVCDVCKGSKIAPREYNTMVKSGRVSSQRPNTGSVPRVFALAERYALRQFEDVSARYSATLHTEPDGARVKIEHLPDGRTLRLRDNGAGWVVESVTQPEPEAASPWVLIDSEDVARSFVGKRVEIDAPSNGRLTAHALHGSALTLRYVKDRELLFDRGVPGMLGAIAWSARGNVRLRVVSEAP